MKLFTSDQSSPALIHSEGLKHVLIMQWDDTGAIVMLSPALRALRAALPRVELTLLTSEAGRQISPLLPWVDHVMVDPIMGQDGNESRLINPRDEIAFMERLRHRNFSLALIFSTVSQSPLRAAFACYLAGIPYRVGFARGMSGSVLSHSLVPPADDLHQVDRNLSLLKAIGIPEADPHMELNIPENVEKRANELLGMAGLKPDIPYIIMAPGAMGALDPYAPHHFAAVARILAAQTEQQVVIVGNSAEVKTIQPVLRAVHENLYGNLYSLVGKTTLPELAAIIRQASLTIANNSVTMQFADTFGCPMVILHSETDMVEQWIPRNSSTRLLSRPADCSRCNREDCVQAINCLDVRPEEVAIAAFELLTKQAYSQSVKGLFEYKLELEENDRFPSR